MKKNLKRLLLSSAAALVFSATTAEAANDYLKIKKTEVEVESKGKKKKLEVEIKTGQAIPMDGKSGAFGYAVLTDGGNNVLVMVTHLPIDDSSYEHKSSGFHTHVLDLKAPTDACKGASFEVDVASSGKNKAFDSDYKWKVKGDKISVKDVPVADLGDAGVEAVAAFTLKPILGADKKPTNLCVTVTDKV